MKKDRILNKIRDIIREQMVMTTGSTPGKPGYSEKADAKGPVAGLSKPLNKRYIYQRGLRKNWKKSGES